MFIVSCTSVKPTTTEIVVLRDVTEKSIAKPNADEILSLFDLQNNQWNGSNFSFGNITDVSYNPINEAKINIQNQWLSNELEREKEIKNFKNRATKIIENSNKDTIGKRNSSIYLPLVRKLNQLSRSNSQKRVLIIYSDLMENTKELSFYNKQTIKILKTKPESIQTQLEQMQQIQDLKGIEIHFVFQPVNPESDSDFKIASEFYKTILQNKGATVTISANLNI